jgi:hypothetical protein
MTREQGPGTTNERGRSSRLRGWPRHGEHTNCRTSPLAICTTGARGDETQKIPDRPSTADRTLPRRQGGPFRIVVVPPTILSG